MYLANPSTEPIRDAIRDQKIGYIATPISSRSSQRVDGAPWCADNGCFGTSKFDIGRWWEWLEEHAADAGTCLFATAPDVVGDHAATVARSIPWLASIRQLGYPAAFVAQDGAEIATVPWDEFDVLFIGGTTDWKLGPKARALVTHAKAISMWVHMGRINSKRRFDYAEHIGCDSADGTYLIFGPDKNLPKLLSWISDSKSQSALFGFGAP